MDRPKWTILTPQGLEAAEAGLTVAASAIVLPVPQEGGGGDLRELREAAVESYSALCKQASPVKPASAPALPRKPKLTLNILMCFPRSIF